MTAKTESQEKLPDFSVLNELMHKSETVGGIIFGSALYGGMWEKSDYDIMLVCRNCSGHTALFLPGDRIWHINIVKLEN
jgi:predicted nucleotidyltransferase